MQQDGSGVALRRRDGRRHETTDGRFTITWTPPAEDRPSGWVVAEGQGPPGPPHRVLRDAVRRLAAQHYGGTLPSSLDLAPGEDETDDDAELEGAA